MSMFKFQGRKRPSPPADSHGQIVYIRFSLNTTTEFYFANACSGVTVFV